MQSIALFIGTKPVIELSMRYIQSTPYLNVKHRLYAIADWMPLKYIMLWLYIYSARIHSDYAFKLYI